MTYTEKQNLVIRALEVAICDIELAIIFPNMAVTKAENSNDLKKYEGQVEAYNESIQILKHWIKHYQNPTVFSECDDAMEDYD